jgi:hypothetical protein
MGLITKTKPTSHSRSPILQLLQIPLAFRGEAIFLHGAMGFFGNGVIQISIQEKWIDQAVQLPIHLPLT